MGTESAEVFFCCLGSCLRVLRFGSELNAEGTIFVRVLGTLSATLAKQQSSTRSHPKNKSSHAKPKSFRCLQMTSTNTCKPLENLCKYHKELMQKSSKMDPKWMPGGSWGVLFQVSPNDTQNDISKLIRPHFGFQAGSLKNQRASKNHLQNILVITGPRLPGQSCKKTTAKIIYGHFLVPKRGLESPKS